jgi:hypothetical protein
VAVDASGDVYVADSTNHRVQKFTSDGTFLTKWGSYGSGDGQFIRPSAIAVDGSGNVFVVDGGNVRIQKFTSTGTFLTKWGSAGGGDGQFGSGLYDTGPGDVAVDAIGDVYVVDTFNTRVQKFTNAGVFLTKWGCSGGGDGQFGNPIGIAVAGSGDQFVLDAATYDNRVQKFACP